MALTRISQNLVSPVQATKTTTYTVVKSDEIIIADTTSTWTLTMPDAATYKGILRIVKSTSDFNQLTINRAGSDTFLGGGTSTSINTQGEMLELVAVGTVWYTISRRIPDIQTAYTPTYTNFGTVATSEMYWCRKGTEIRIQGRWIAQAVSAAEGRVSLPSGLTAGGASLITNRRIAGEFASSVRPNADIYPTIEPSAAYFNFGKNNTNATMSVANSNDITYAGDYCTVCVQFPITGWNG